MSSNKTPTPVNKPSAPSATPGDFDAPVSGIVRIHGLSHALAGDQPPIGILMCTRKNDALVEFGLGDLNNQVFVSRCAVELPRKEEMEHFIAQISQEAGA